MKRIRWPDNSTNEAATWRLLFAAVRRAQFSDYGALGFRFELCRRAKVWTGTRVWPLHSWPRLARSLAAAKLFTILQDD